MILSPKAGGVGLTITSANHVIHLSRWWNPAVEDQATDRVFRIGQTREVHVYLPMAVHPDADIRASSFDLRLDALIERKKALTRELFSPPEPTDGDLEQFFKEVSLGGLSGDAVNAAEDLQPYIGGDARMAEALAGESQSDDGDALGPLPALPSAVKNLGIRRWRCNAGEARPTVAVVSLFSGKSISLVAIKDPYALVHRRARAAQIAFISELKAVSRSIDTVMLEYAPDIDDEPDASRRGSFVREYERALGQGAPKVLLQARLRKVPNDDFHDRFVEIDVKAENGKTDHHEITIGRGLQALFDERWQCTVTYAPPGSD